MGRPTKAAERTAYDLGYEHGRNDTAGGPPEWVNTTELMSAYDDGLAAGTDSLDTAAAVDSKVKPPRHRAKSTAPRPRSKTPAKTATRAPARSRRRFSHPAHWGSGARGHTVGRPSLTPPRGLSSRDWTGFGFGLVLYALGAAYIKYGPGGPTAWLKAKFINDTTAAAGLGGGAGFGGGSQILTNLDAAGGQLVGALPKAKTTTATPKARRPKAAPAPKAATR